MVQITVMSLSTKNKLKLEQGAARATKWIGSMPSLITHTILFVSAFILPLFGVPFERVLLVLTTIVSLEAIYLSIFIQMSVNKNTADIEDIAEDVEDIQEEIEDIAEDVEEIQEDIEDIEEEHEKDYKEDRKLEKKEAQTLDSIQETLSKLYQEIETLKKK